VARIIFATEQGEQHVDVAALRGPTIEADLRARDFTVNAMAVLAHRPWGPLIDPTGGEMDLEARVLRAASVTAFHDDPARILRGVRLRASLGFTIDPQTESLMRQCLPALASVSGERVRDEILLLLSCTAAAPALRYGESLGAFQIVLPDSIPPAALAPGVCAVGLLEQHLPLVLGLAEDCEGRIAEDTELSRLLAEYAVRLRAPWSSELSSGHPRWLLLKLAAWLGSALPACSSSGLAPANLAADVMRRLRLSVNEERYLAGAWGGVSLLSGWPDDLRIGPLDAYRYYRRTGDAGVDGAILAVVQRVVREETCAASSCLAQLCARARFLLHAWFERKAGWVDPPPLVSGYDLMRAVGLRPGPALGECLERIREAQVQGLVSTPEQAFSFVREQQD